MPIDPKEFAESYRDYARKMDLFIDGPTTTIFEQLIGAGIELPPPASIAPERMTTKLWEVLATLATLHIYLDVTGHLTDSELYAKLWHDLLREEIPAGNELGFAHLIDVVDCSNEADAAIYLRYYADEQYREQWVKNSPGFVLPPQEDAPIPRDCIVPRPRFELGPDARDWLRANPSPQAFAAHRFTTTGDALAFAEGLHAHGATAVLVQDIRFPASNGWLPYADALRVSVPNDGARDLSLSQFIEEVGRPDRHEMRLEGDTRMVTLWWH